MKWRNDQIYHLQNKPLTEEDQVRYFEASKRLFEEQQPNQLLFFLFRR
jgi:hypothetical protein